MQSCIDLIANFRSALERGQQTKLLKSLEKQIIGQFSTIAHIDEFYQLPFSAIANILKQIDFNIDVPSFGNSLLKTVIMKICDIKKQEAPLLLGIISKPFSTLDECMSLIGCFKQCPLCVRTYSLYEEDIKQVDYDIDYELEQKDKTIQELTKKIQELETQFSQREETEMPIDIETNILEASKQGKLSSVQYLIEHENVDPEIKSNSGNTPLHYTSQEGHLHIVKYLIEKHHIDINNQKEGENTPLCDASYYGHFEIVQYLVEHGADIDAQGWMGETPLHKAAKNGFTEIVKFLLLSGANKEIKDASGKKPAQCSRNGEILALLI